MKPGSEILTHLTHDTGGNVYQVLYLTPTHIKEMVIFYSCLLSSNRNKKTDTPALSMVYNFKHIHLHLIKRLSIFPKLVGTVVF